ncbi:MAG: TonB-dependent receptor [Bryobacterales bacterium]|nr:TonB-dependent receptor [Bryobacterales bacterium]MEB2359835.1 TonB-dependent receptor [Bryobacterales bacterium]
MRYLIVLLLAGWSVQAQNQSSRPQGHRVSGAVTDSTGLPVPDVKITLYMSGETSGTRRTETNVEGRFSFESVPAGEARLVARAPDFSDSQQEIEITRDISNLQIRLELAARSEEVTVTAERDEPELSPAGNADALEFDSEMLYGLPVLDQDILAAAGEFVDDSAMGSEGVSLVVDGMETDQLGVSPSAIAEVRINRNRYSAEFSRPGRGRIEVITKQGSNQFHGSFMAGLRDARMNARNAFSPSRPPQQRRFFEGHLTGPLAGSGNTTFLLSVERQTDEIQQPVFARTPSGLFQQSLVQPERETGIYGRVNRYVGERHVLSWRYGYDREWQKRGIGGFNLPESAYVNRDRDHVAGFGYRWFPSATFFSDLEIRYRNSHETNRSETPDAARIVVNDAFTGGGAQQDQAQDRNRLSLNWTFSNTRGRHSLRWGITTPTLEWQRLVERNNFGGTYQFASLEDYVAGRPLSYTVRVGEPDMDFFYWQGSAFFQDDVKLSSRLTLGLGLRYDAQGHLGDYNNIAPRLSIAWGLNESGNTVIRAGGGMFYDRLGIRTVSDLLQLNGLRLRDLQILAPAYPVLDTGSTAALPPNIVELSRRAKLPYSFDFSGGIEHRFTRDFRLGASYSVTRGTNLWRTIDANAPLPPDFERPMHSYGFIREIQSSGTMKSQGLHISANGRILRFFRGQLRYRLGSSHNDTGGLPPDSLDMRGQWARAGWDRRHRFRAAGLVDLPKSFGLGIIYSASSGRPYEWTTGLDLNRDGLALERPSGVGRNALQMPGESRLDLRLSRAFRLSGGTSERSPGVVVSLDGFNVLNRVNYTRLVGNQSSPFFGKPVAASAARRLQASVRFTF